MDDEHLQETFLSCPEGEGMFGSMKCQCEWLIEKALSIDVFIAIGTSGHVYPAANFLLMARRHGAHTGINLDPPETCTSLMNSFRKAEKFSRCSSKSGRNHDQCFCNVLRSNNHASEHLVDFHLDCYCSGFQVLR